MAGEKQFTQQSRLGESLIRVIDGQAGRYCRHRLHQRWIRPPAEALLKPDSGLAVREFQFIIKRRIRLAQPDLRIEDTLVEPVYLGDQVSLKRRSCPAILTKRACGWFESPSNVLMSNR